MNLQTNIQSLNIDIHAYKLRKVFDDYSMVTSYPINREQFFKDAIKATIPDTVYVFDNEGTCVKVENSF
jgi:hypothetical protein